LPQRRRSFRAAQRTERAQRLTIVAGAVGTMRVQIRRLGRLPPGSLQRLRSGAWDAGACWATVLPGWAARGVTAILGEGATVEVPIRTLARLLAKLGATDATAQIGPALLARWTTGAIAALFLGGTARKITRAPTAELLPRLAGLPGARGRSGTEVPAGAAAKAITHRGPGTVLIALTIAERTTIPGAIVPPARTAILLGGAATELAIQGRRATGVIERTAHAMWLVAAWWADLGPQGAAEPCAVSYPGATVRARCRTALRFLLAEQHRSRTRNGACCTDVVLLPLALLLPSRLQHPQ
jgi:hypothetical protein